MRAIAIDTLRGLCLVMMTFDHLLITPFDSWKKLYVHAYGPLGFFSAAEVFFFLSGLLIGFIIAAKPDISFSYRIKKLYLANILAILFLALLMHLFPVFQAWNQENLLKPFMDAPLLAIMASALFLYLPYYFDVLPLYCLFFLLIPLIRTLLFQGKVALLLGGSFIIWFCGQWAVAQHVEKYFGQWFVTKLPWFDPCAWQILFVVAVVLGYLYKKNPQYKLFNPSLNIVIAVGTFCGFCLCVRHYYAGEANVLTSLTEVKTLGVVRLINFFAAVFFVYGVIKKLPAFKMNILARLGSVSLVVFMYHAFLIYFLSVFYNEISLLSTMQKIIIAIAAICSLWIPPVGVNYYKKMVALKQPKMKQRVSPLV